MDTPIEPGVAPVPGAGLKVTHGQAAEAVKFTTLPSLVLRESVCCEGATPPDELKFNDGGLNSSVGPNTVNETDRFWRAPEALIGT